MSKKKLTDPFIKSIPAPKKDRIEYYDEIVGGLALRVTKTGHKSFVYRYRFGTKSRRFTIGVYPSIKLAQARGLARDLSLKVKTGIDPLDEKQREQRKVKPVTVSELADSFITNYL